MSCMYVGVCGREGEKGLEAFRYVALNRSKVCPGDIDMHLYPTLDCPNQFLGMGPNASH